MQKDFEEIGKWIKEATNSIQLSSLEGTLQVFLISHADNAFVVDRYIDLYRAIFIKQDQLGQPSESAIKSFFHFTQLLKVIRRLIKEIQRLKRRNRIAFTFVFNHLKIKGENMDLQLKVSGGPVTGHINPLADNNAVEKVQDGSVSISSSNESVFTVEEDPDDQLKFTITPVGVGTAQLNVSADADLGDGVTTITGSSNITVVEEEATKLDIVFDTPGSQPAAGDNAGN